MLDTEQHVIIACKKIESSALEYNSETPGFGSIRIQCSSKPQICILLSQPAELHGLISSIICPLSHSLNSIDRIQVASTVCLLIVQQVLEQTLQLQSADAVCCSPESVLPRLKEPRLQNLKNTHDTSPFAYTLLSTIGIPPWAMQVFNADACRLFRRRLALELHT